MGAECVLIVAWASSKVWVLVSGPTNASGGNDRESSAGRSRPSWWMKGRTGATVSSPEEAETAARCGTNHTTLDGMSRDLFDCIVRGDLRYAERLLNDLARK